MSDWYKPAEEILPDQEAANEVIETAEAILSEQRNHMQRRDMIARPIYGGLRLESDDGMSTIDVLYSGRGGDQGYFQGSIEVSGLPQRGTGPTDIIREVNAYQTALASREFRHSGCPNFNYLGVKDGTSAVGEEYMEEIRRMISSSDLL